MQQTTTVTVNQLTFDCLIEGDKKNELVVLLHGFPESSYMWRDLMKVLANNGFYCVAPNLRGYSKNACPKGKKHYTLTKLVSDVVGIAKHFSTAKFHLIGHDWGAAIGWKVAHDYKDFIISWTALSVPHIQAFCFAIFNDAEQQQKSQYIKNFQLPFLPELKIRKNNFALFKKLWVHSDADEVANYLSIFKNKKQLTAAISYYRSNYALFKKATTSNILGTITVPTLFIWGKKDMAIGSYAVEEGHEYVKGYYEFIALDDGHWLIQTAYKKIEAAILHHLHKFKTS
ncbi:alpha/beta hydrolase [Tenacibaculum tangerinum]|uniref:Alpha/beta hydrolase n=1 Tax=Tenacibaculum tangerinum TaxID=3038772 RepID=A0ABY8KZK6_9FLAO|nr:alpha/beta hydrolase [Tenacibaculum tangerinum]WGH74662.1 alpha/beta hydrolase [Tenacibaculum tangerinum]